MKPTIIVIQPTHVTSDSIIEEFCEAFCDSHHVYLVRPDSGFRDDSPAGIRFLSNPLDSLPDLPSVDTAISVGDHDVVRILHEVYPHANKAVWDPEIETGFPTAILPMKPAAQSPRILRNQPRPGFAKAM